MTLRKLSEGEVVYRKGEIATEMFIIMSGAVGLFSDDECQT